MTPTAKPQTPLTDALYQPTHASLARVKLETGYQHACKLEKESALLTERLSLSQQDRHTLEVECRELRVQNDKLRRALQPFAEFAKQYARKPMRQQHDILHAIHAGTEWEAEIRISYCEEARACLAAIEQEKPHE